MPGYTVGPSSAPEMEKEHGHTQNSELQEDCTQVDPNSSECLCSYLKSVFLTRFT